MPKDIIINDKDGDELYPITYTYNVIDKNNSSLDEILYNKIDDITIENGIMYLLSDGLIKKEMILPSFVPVARSAYKTYKTYTINIDLNNSNPETCCTYANDAMNMIPGSDEWDKIFGEYPCILKDGEQVAKLNPDDYNKKINGESTLLYGQDCGDVMICFPRRGIRIEKNEDNILTVSLTTNPNDSDFYYYAHNRGEELKDDFYIGAYNCCLESDNIWSWSEKTPTSNLSLQEYRQYANNKGSGYDLISFYQILYLQVLYLLKYKTLDSQNEIKLFGIEDLLSNMNFFIEGIGIDESGNLRTATDNFNSDFTDYKNLGQCVTINGFINDVYGTNELGFLGKEGNGSSSTYFCSLVKIDNDANLKEAYLGMPYNIPDSKTNIFSLNISNTVSTANENIGCRLMYL